ncbi:MAG: hypothetical protein EU547_06720 [Promethearchaeota archaeon]|nr:MAG: hypothetical protein EU547_06720 [Candidatus Lokiarchaeota archaeon]
MRVVEEVWIVNPSGVTMFNLSEGEKIDPQLIGGFFTAIQQFVESLGEKNLKTIILGDSKITVYQGFKNLLFIARSKKNVKDKKLISYIEFVEEQFKLEFGDIIDTWNGATEIFDPFGVRIKEIFEDTPEKRTKEALW